MDDRKSLKSSTGILRNGNSWTSMEGRFAPFPPSANFVNASIVAFVGLLLFVMSFTSPYWLVSYEYTYSDFKNMGLWEFCFDGYRYPKYQFDYKFVGCNYIFASEYRIIWEWMLPVWFMATQTFMCIALMCLMACMTAASLVLTRWPMQFVLRFEWRIIGLCAALLAATEVCLFFSLIVFGLMCWSRDWLLYPNYNYLSWSYYFAVFSGGFFGFAGFMMLYEMYKSKDRKRAANNLLHLENQNGHNGGEPMEIPIDPGYQQQPYQGSNPGFSREQSVYSQASGLSHPSAYSHNAYI
ncbi:uncharacterized protein LOC108675283 isoform X2 [Hyalella azteca]|uniref:Uncharacterized protein LOC108675283 isoform X2 n=1 Tax=Hyalella azteca TaxID=294128 RepID=A0A8B7NY82_HYAAZ|nr:uncharacterized protein LOC108675283 isoform X2 [Hyalella azteca]